jgi:hypothetical protein
MFGVPSGQTLSHATYLLNHERVSGVSQFED